VVDRHEAEALLASWNESGVSLPAFARASGIDGRSLNCWRLNLTRSRLHRAEQPLRLVELAVAAPAARDAVYLVRVGEVEVEVGDDFREETLARLLRVVSRC
jgi:hypothetical protein